MVKGATSFEDMATVDGVIHDTFRSACLARGMQADDGEIIAAMREIIDVTIRVEDIRHHFAMLLLHNAPADPQALFNLFVDDLCDIDDGADAVETALLSIDSVMQRAGKSLADTEFGFILPDTVNLRRSRKRQRLRDPAAAVVEAQAQRDAILPLFTDEQTAALQQIVTAICSVSNINTLIPSRESLYNFLSQDLSGPNSYY